MSDLQIAMRAAKIDHIRATRRFGASMCSLCALSRRSTEVFIDSNKAGSAVEANAEAAITRR